MSVCGNLFIVLKLYTCFHTVIWEYLTVWSVVCFSGLYVCTRKMTCIWSVWVCVQFIFYMYDCVRETHRVTWRSSLSAERRQDVSPPNTTFHPIIHTLPELVVNTHVCMEEIHSVLRTIVPPCLRPADLQQHLSRTTTRWDGRLKTTKGTWGEKMCSYI